MGDDVSHSDLLAEIRVQGTKLDRMCRDISQVNDTLSRNTGRLVAIERWIESHNTIVRFLKWAMATALVGVGLFLAWRSKN